MPEFVRLHKLTPKGAKDIKDFKKLLGEYRKRQKERGVKVIASYACLGKYDFISIIDAPDDKTAFIDSLDSKETVSTITMKAMKTEEFAEMTSKM